tara:strand:+ start:13765 stop:15639 length:1875 start_codon:yes stop_codon:yes gene_type:complete
MSLRDESEVSRPFVPGSYHGFRSINLACKTERVPVDWDGTYASLTRSFTEEFTQNEEIEGVKLLDREAPMGCMEDAKRAFRLWDPHLRLAYENFSLDDVREGDTIQVNFEQYDVMLMRLDEKVSERKAENKRRKRGTASLGEKGDRSSLATGGNSLRRIGSNKSIGSGSVESSPRALRGEKSTSLLAMPSVIGANLLKRVKSLKDSQALRSRMAAEKRAASGGYSYDSSRWAFLTRREKIWVTLDDPSSSLLASVIAASFLLLILFSTTMYCAQTLHGIYREVFSKNSVWFVSEAFCILCFTVELGLRLYASPDRKKFAKEPMNVVDFLAIFPFYVDLIAEWLSNGDADAIPGLAVIRVLRLARLFKLLRASKDSMDLFAETMVRSVKALNMLLLLITIGVVVFSSLIYYIERGRWNEVTQHWESAYAYSCSVTVDYTSRGEPNAFSEVSKPGLSSGEALNDTDTTITYAAGEDNPCELQSVSHDATSVVFLCEYPYKRWTSCVTLYRQSQFDSIARSFWWTFVTMTTVGYGDTNPGSVLGKCFGGFVMCFGVLVVALPVTVIGSNFSAVFHRNLAEEKAVRKKMRAELRREKLKSQDSFVSSTNTSKESSPSFSRLGSLNERG